LNSYYFIYPCRFEEIGGGEGKRGGEMMSEEEDMRPPPPFDIKVSLS